MMAAFETMHFMKGLKKGQQTKMAIKLDMAKAYDRVEWSFFQAIMLRLGFASEWSCEAVKNIFQVYEETSGQKFKFTKSALSLSPNATAVEKQIVLDLLTIPLVYCHEKYLGLPMVTGKGRKQIFKTVKDRIGKRISGWKEKLLSRAGKEILIKVVLHAMPTYSMSCFRMPKGICKELHGLMAKF
ncbi:unnamed protein product [Prunus armeniaca]